MIITDIILILGFVVSLATFVWTIRSGLRSLHSKTLTVALSSYIPVEQMLAKTPTALRFHGISKNDLKDQGLSEEEFTYLLSNFTAGGIYFRTAERDNLGSFQADEGYYYRMLQKPDTRKAWKVVKRCMQPSSYTKIIEETIQTIEEQEKRDATSS